MLYDLERFWRVESRLLRPSEYPIWRLQRLQGPPVPRWEI
jgi:hypothetical protein